MEAERKERDQKLARVIARAWADESFKERLLSDPRGVLAEEGLPVPPGVAVTVLEQTDRQFYLVLPPKPAAGGGIEELDHREAAGCGGNGGAGGWF